MLVFIASSHSCLPTWKYELPRAMAKAVNPHSVQSLKMLLVSEMGINRVPPDQGDGREGRTGM